MRVLFCLSSSTNEDFALYSLKYPTKVINAKKINMIDIKLIIDNPDFVVKALKKKCWDFDPKEVLELSKKRKELILATEANKAEQNKLSKQVPEYKKEHILNTGTAITAKIFVIDDIGKTDTCSTNLMLSITVI